ncbi:uncharacterized protein LOC117340234 [Pecten maximus]|uniref:uncharacterized protein LOC117340234 n=1 Tax=Pecten maximus TaxID=6579 RepID=UPI001457F165|nr:uncharacterized protein LOC117340234 [Pecten maximus]
MKDSNLQKRTTLIAELLEKVGKDYKCPPVNIVLVGPPGCGKSSFINSFAASIANKCWQEFAYSGRLGTGGTSQTTVRVQSIVAADYGTAPNVKGYSLPTLIDLTGFENMDEELTAEILRLIFYGKLKNATNIHSVFSFGNRYGVNALRCRYAMFYPEIHFKVDRVVFLASATGEVVPERLIGCVMKAARPQNDIYKREIPVFGVLTGIDLVVDESQKEVYKERKRKFMGLLALEGSGHRFLECFNYCDDVDPTMTRIDKTLPHVDVPILEFMNVVCGRNFVVTNSDESYFDASCSLLKYELSRQLLNALSKIPRGTVVLSSFTGTMRRPVSLATPPDHDPITIISCVASCLLSCLLLLYFLL